MENIGFSERFVACDLKVGTYIQLIELMKSYVYSRSMTPFDIGQRYILYLKLNFLRNHCTNQSQILYVLSLGRGTKVCINAPGHMTKMAAMPIYW